MRRVLLLLTTVVSAGLLVMAVWTWVRSEAQTTYVRSWNRDLTRACGVASGRGAVLVWWLRCDKRADGPEAGFSLDHAAEASSMYDHYSTFANGSGSRHAWGGFRYARFEVGGPHTM